MRRALLLAALCAGCTVSVSPNGATCDTNHAVPKDHECWHGRIRPGSGGCTPGCVAGPDGGAAGWYATCQDSPAFTECAQAAQQCFDDVPAERRCSVPCGAGGACPSGSACDCPAGGGCDDYCFALATCTPADGGPSGCAGTAVCAGGVCTAPPPQLSPPLCAPLGTAPVQLAGAYVHAFGTDSDLANSALVPTVSFELGGAPVPCRFQSNLGYCALDTPQQLTPGTYLADIGAGASGDVWPTREYFVLDARTAPNSGRVTLHALTKTTLGIGDEGSGWLGAAGLGATPKANHAIVAAHFLACPATGPAIALAGATAGLTQGGAAHYLAKSGGLVPLDDGLTATGPLGDALFLEVPLYADTRLGWAVGNASGATPIDLGDGSAATVVEIAP